MEAVALFLASQTRNFGANDGTVRFVDLSCKVAVGSRGNTPLGQSAISQKKLLTAAAKEQIVRAIFLVCLYSRSQRGRLMSKTRKSLDDDFDPSDILSDPDLDPETFVDSMARGQKPRGSWKRVDDLNDEKWLRAQLADWEDWE
jgi:hypothetical protein